MTLVERLSGRGTQHQERGEPAQAFSHALTATEHFLGQVPSSGVFQAAVRGAGPRHSERPSPGIKRSGYSPSDGNRSRKAWVMVTMTSRGSPWLRTSMPDSVSARGSSVAS